MKYKSILLTSLLMLNIVLSYAQIRENLTKTQHKFIENDYRQFKFSKNSFANADSAIVVQYKGAMYAFMSNGHSIWVSQNISINKIKSFNNETVLKGFTLTKEVYKGLKDSFIWDKITYKALFSVGAHKELNNPNIKVVTNDSTSDINDLYFEVYKK